MSDQTTTPITPASLKGALELLRMQQSEIERLRTLLNRWLELDGDRNDIAALIADTRNAAGRFLG